MSIKGGRVPGLGYEVASCVLSLSVTDIRSRTVHGSIGLLLKKSPTNEDGGDVEMDVYEEQATLRLNCRNLGIESVRVDGINCKFRVLDYLKRLAGEKCRDLLSLSACLAGDLVAAAEGELEISLVGKPTQETLAVEIDFHFRDGVAIFCFCEEKAESDLDEHMYTNIGFSYSSELGGGCGARCIFPCVDSTKSRFPVKMFIETHRDHIAIAPGKFVGTVISSPSTHIFEFDHSSPVAPYAVGFAVGAFVKIPHPTFSWFNTYVLSSRASRFVDVPSKLSSCIETMLEYLDQKDSPPTEYSQVFIGGERASDTILPFNSLAILSDDLIFERDLEWVSAEREIESLLAQCVGLACQWFGCGSEMGASSPGDVWIPMGLAMFTAMQTLRIAMGNTCFHLLLSKWTKRVRETHARAASVAAYHSKPGIVLGRPLGRPKPYALPVDAALWAVRGCSFDSPFAAKAGLTMHMLERRASKMVFYDVIKRLARASRGPQSSKRKSGHDESMHRPKLLSELAFLTLLKSRAGALAQDIDSTFVTQWLRHSYIPKFTGEVTYSQKTNRIEVLLRQQPQEGGRIYMGAIKIRIVESGGAWEYDKQIDHVEHLWVFECRSVKRKGRGGRKAREEEERSMKWRNPESQDAKNLVNLASSFYKAKKFWELNSPVRYVLLDPDSWWIMDLTWKQPEENWLEMLHDATMKDDVYLQRFAIEQLTKHSFSKDPASHLRAASAIAALAGDKSRENEVRVDAAKALLIMHEKNAPASVNATAGSSGGSWMVKDLVVTTFRKLFCDDSGDPLPFFTKNGGYSVRAALLETISAIRGRDGSIPDDVKALVFDSARLCDNSNNPFDDGPMLSNLAVASGKLLAGIKREEAMSQTGNLTSDQAQDNEVAETIRWIKSALDFDSVSSSPRNRKITTIGCLEALCEMELAGVIKPGSTNFAAYMEHSFWRNDCDVRVKAFECITHIHVKQRVSKGAKWMRIVHWLIRACATDPCVATRSRMMKELLAAHADSVGRHWSELEGNKSPAGCFWPLLNRPSHMAFDELAGARAVANSLWELINEKSAFDCSLRILSHQLWRLIWKLDDVPAFEGLDFAPENLGHLEKWVDEAEQEYMRDEKSIIHLDEFKTIQARQMELVKEREEAKRLRDERQVREPEPAATTPGAASTTSDKEAVMIQEGEEEEDVVIEEDEEEEIVMSEGGSSNPAREDGAISTGPGEDDDDDDNDDFQLE